MNDTTRSSECLRMFEHRGFAGVQALRRDKVGLLMELRGVVSGVGAVVVSKFRMMVGGD